MAVGVDVGTNSLVAATADVDGNIVYKTERDCFYRIVPKSKVNRSAIKTSLEQRGSSFIEDGNDLIVVGEQAIQIALDRNDSTMRPMQQGVISPKDKANLPMLKLLLKGLIGEGSGTLVYSTPSEPIDGGFDIEYHTSLLNMFFSELGYSPIPINEAFAIGLSELLDEGLTGITISSGAGMQNVAIMAQGDPIVTFSTLRSGDYIDQMVGTALDLSPSLVQLEKEAGVNLLAPNNKIMEAVVVYYQAVINYTIRSIMFELNKRKKNLPVFREPVPVVLGGGLAWADGYVEVFEKALRATAFPFEIGTVKRADNPNYCVAKGALLASQL